MIRHTLMPSYWVFTLLTFLLGFALPAAAAADARVSESYGKLPLHFEANQGQAHEKVRFLARGSGYSLYLTAGEAVLVLAKTNPVATPDAHITNMVKGQTWSRVKTWSRVRPILYRRMLTFPPEFSFASLCMVKGHMVKGQAYTL
jgi:hypothetical protein